MHHHRNKGFVRIHLDTNLSEATRLGYCGLVNSHGSPNFIANSKQKIVVEEFNRQLWQPDPNYGGFHLGHERGTKVKLPFTQC